MEDTLRVKAKNELGKKTIRLNPCFNGRYSQRVQLHYLKIRMYNVLILVLMEDTLRVINYFNQLLETES